MEVLGLPAATTPHRGGETQALCALEELLKREEYVATFAKPDTAPTTVKRPATTLLSPHLHFGSLSVREIY
jgi:cryptochrome